MKLLAILMLLGLSIPAVSQTTSKTPGSMTLPVPAGGMTVEVVTDNDSAWARIQKLKDTLVMYRQRLATIDTLKKVMDQMSEKEPHVAIVLGCLLSYLYMGKEAELSERCLRFTKEMLDMNRPSNNQ